MLKARGIPSLDGVHLLIMKGGFIMKAIEELLKNPATIALSFFILVYAIKEGYELFKWWKNRAHDYHASVSEREDFQRRVDDNTETLSDIKKSLNGLNSRIDNIEMDRKMDILAMGRIQLYQFYEKLKDKEEITAGESDAFNAIADRFLAAGGNGTFKRKIIPAIQSKPVEGR